MALDLNWEHLSESTETARTRYKFADVQHLMRKVAFDIYKQIGDKVENLWELREEDGTKYLYSVYDDAADLTAKSSDDADWQATSDRDGKNVTLSFKQLPLVRFAAAEHGFAPDEADGFAKFLQTKARDQEFVSELVKQLPDAKQAALASLLNGSTN
jgi:hypothetical protein